MGDLWDREERSWTFPLFAVAGLCVVHLLSPSGVPIEGAADVLYVDDVSQLRTLSGCVPLLSQRARSANSTDINLTPSFAGPVISGWVAQSTLSYRWTDWIQAAWCVELAVMHPVAPPWRS